MSRPTFYSPAGSLMEIENKIDFGLVLEKIKKFNSQRDAFETSQEVEGKYACNY